MDEKLSLRLHLGLRIVLWIVDVLLATEISEEQRQELKNLRTSFAVWR